MQIITQERAHTHTHTHFSKKTRKSNLFERCFKQPHMQKHFISPNFNFIRLPHTTYDMRHTRHAHIYFTVFMALIIYDIALQSFRKRKILLISIQQNSIVNDSKSIVLCKSIQRNNLAMNRNVVRFEGKLLSRIHFQFITMSCWILLQRSKRHRQFLQQIGLQTLNCRGSISRNTH